MRETHFIRTSLIGACFVLMPIVVVIFLLGKAFELMSHLGEAAAGLAGSQLPTEITTHLPLTTILTALFLVALCYGLGRLVAPRTDLQQGTALERAVLFRIPGYQIVRGIAMAVLGFESSKSVRPALLRREEGVAELVLVVEALPDDRHVVFLPESPAPFTGTVLIVDAAMLEILPANAVAAAQTFSRWGGGTAALLAGKAPQDGPPAG